MGESASAIVQFDPASAKLLLDQFAISQAATQALSGDYASAETLLKDLVQRPDAPPEALALQAKICVQQGRLVEAERLWHRALEKDPSNSKYHAALSRLSRIQQRPIWLLVVWPLVLSFGVVVLGFAALRIQWDRRRTEFTRLEGLIEHASAAASKSNGATASALLAQMDSLQRNQLVLSKNQETFADQIGDVRRLSQSLDALKIQERGTQSEIQQARRQLQLLGTKSSEIAQEAHDLLAAWSLSQKSMVPAPTYATDGRQIGRVSGPAAIPPPVRPPMRLDLQIEGVTVISQDDHLILRFDDGLFDYDDHFKIGSTKLLQSVARKLVQSQEKLVIEIIGTAENEPPIWPWGAAKDPDILSLARAEKVEQLLGGLGIFPAAALRTAVGRTQDLPFPNNTAVNDRRNRSVVLIVSQADDQLKPEQ